MVNSRDPLGVKTQNKKAIKRKSRPQWDSSINDVGSMKLSKSEVEKRTKLYSARHMEKIRNEIKAMQRKEKTVESAIHSSPFTAHNRSVVVQNTYDTKTKLQELLNETDRKMFEARDLFGDHGYKYRVVPNVTSAPHVKQHSPITIVRSVFEDRTSPPTALNDTQKLGVVTVETLPPDTTGLDLRRIKQLLIQEKENLLTAQNTLLNSTSVNTTGTQINKVLDFNDDLPSVRMEGRSRRKVRISDVSEPPPVETTETRDKTRDKTLWSPVPLEVKEVVVGSKPDKRDSTFETSPPRLRESSSESLISPSRIKRQQSLEKEKKNKTPRDSPVEDEKRGPTSPKSPKETTSPVRLVSVCGPPLANSISEHRYPPVLKIPAIRENLAALDLTEVDERLYEDPVRCSRNPSGCSSSPEKRTLVSTATSPLRPLSPRDKKETTSIATSPVRGLENPVRATIKDLEGATNEKRAANTPNPPLNIERDTTDRPYTDQQLKDRLEHLIVGGHYPFAKVQQKSYAITDLEQGSEKKASLWIRANMPENYDAENITFVDSSPLKGAALELELKLRKYQSQIGAKPTKKPPMSGFSGYTSLLLQSVSSMVSYLTEQECTTEEERKMRNEVIETMSALQNTVETLSTELLSCRKDLSDTKQKVQTLEHDYSATLAFLIDNCVLKDPSLQTPLSAQRVKQLPTVISPFTTTTSQPPPVTTTPDLMTFTPHPSKSENLMEFTPSEPPPADTLVQITPETSEQYLQYLDEKTAALRNGLDAKINKMNASVEKPTVRPENRDNLYAPEKSKPADLTSLTISTLTDDGLDLSQDLDALIERLKQMNAQTLAVSSQQMGITPKKADSEAHESLNNIKDMLRIEGGKSIEAATRVIESYKKPSEFSPSQLLPDYQESTPNSTDKSSNRSASRLSGSSVTASDGLSQNHLSAEVSPIMMSPPDVVRASGRISGEYIGVYSGNNPGAQRPVSPNPLSPRRIQEEINRSTLRCRVDLILPPKEPKSPNISEDLANRLGMPISSRSPKLSRSSSSIFQSPSAFSPPTKQTSERELEVDLSSPDSSPQQDTTSLINEFLFHNPHYLKKISESLASASLPSFPTSPTQVSTRRAPQDDEVTKENSKPNVVKSSICSSGVAEAVVKGSVVKNIAKFEKKREQAELERERSISPKRPSSSRTVRPRSALSPERKPGSPERKPKRRVSWGEDQVVQEENDAAQQIRNEPESSKTGTKASKENPPDHETSEIVMKPNRAQLPERRVPETEKTVNGPPPKSVTTNAAPKKRAEEKAHFSNDVPQNYGTTDIKPTENGDSEPSLESGSDLMTQLLTLNDAKLTELVTTLNKLTER